MSKFKVGDKVIHEKFGKGKVVEEDTGIFSDNILVQFEKKNIVLHNGNGNCKGKYEDKTCWHFNDDDNELKKIELKELTKNDLKDGDIVTLRNGDRLVCYDGDFRDIGDDYSNELSDVCDLNEDMTYDGNDRNSDIMKVERAIEYETIFDRQNIIKEMTIAEIEQALGHGVKVIKEED